MVNRPREIIILSRDTKTKLLKTAFIFISLYIFLLSIKLLGHSFQLFGEGFAEAMLKTTANPFTGLIMGIVATSLIQSSSTTTSIVVGMVAGGALSLNNAIPIIMGANIGTTITNTLVSFGHITRRAEFRRAFSAGVIHDFFNIAAVLVLFPLELKFGLIEKTALLLEEGFSGAGGLKMFNPLKILLDPVINIIDVIFSNIPYNHFILMILSLIMLFGALTFLVRNMRSLVLDKLELIINNYLFKNDVLGFVFGIIMTAIVQSSSVTTSLIIPLAGAGIIRLRQIFPYTVGANIGTTVTAILAALATQNHVAITVAFAHLVFNLFGIIVIYPFKFLLIKLAQFVGEKAALSKKNLVIFLGAYLSVYIIPLIFIIIFEIHILSGH